MLSESLGNVIVALRKGQISAAELCEKCISRTQQVKQLNAYITQTIKLSRKQAQDADIRLQKGKPLGPLDGIPVAVKDNFCTAGVRTTCGSQMLQSYIPPYSATVVNKLLSGGAVLMGKTNLDEFAMGCGTIDSIAGPTRNPWSIDYNHNTHNDGEQDNTQEESEPDWFIAGGSSGGSAVAVTTGTAFAALGSDTGGSVRNPASYCGIVGFKPTYGLLSRHGLIPLVNSMDVPGIFTRTVQDCAVILNILAGHDVKDSTTVHSPEPSVLIPQHTSVNGLHVGIPMEYNVPGISPDVVKAWNNVADRLERGGARVSRVSMPHTSYSIMCYSILCACEVASNMARYDGIEYGHRAKNEDSTEVMYAASRHEGFNDVVRGRILAGNYFLLKRNYDKYFLQAQRVRRLICQDFHNVYNSGVDMLLAPTTLSDAIPYSIFRQADSRSRTMEQDVFTQSINMAGVPAVTLPISLSSKHLPIGLQLIGKPFKEQQLLNVAKWIENEVNFPLLNLDYLDDIDLKENLGIERNL